MVRIGTPEDIGAYFMTDDDDLIFRLHQAGFAPVWKDFDVVFFKKTNKLLKLLKKLEIDVD